MYNEIMPTPQNIPDPNTIHPIAGYDKEIYVKPTLKNPNIIVGDFAYIADSEFESHVTHEQRLDRSQEESERNARERVKVCPI